MFFLRSMTHRFLLDLAKYLWWLVLVILIFCFWATSLFCVGWPITDLMILISGLLDSLNCRFSILVVLLYQMFAISFFVMFLCCYAWKHFRRDCKRPCRPHWDWPLCCRHAREQEIQRFLYPWTLTSKGESLWGQVDFRIQYVAECVYCISLTPTKVFHLILWWKYSFFLQRSFEICRRLILSHVYVAVRVLSFWWFWVSFGLMLFLRILSCTAKQGTELPLAFSLFISAG